MADTPERIYANDANHWHQFPGEEGTAEYVRADIYAKELARLAIESNARELALAALECDVIAIRSRIRFLEKALEQALMYEQWAYSDERRCPELAQYLQEKKEE